MIKQLKDFPMYYVSDEGDVYSKVNNAGKERKDLYKLKKCIDRDGYEIVGIHHKTKAVHRLIAETFIPNPDNKPAVNHIDGNKRNNKVSNLEWVTYSENSQHAFDNNLIEIKNAEDHHSAKLTNEEYINIIQMTLDGYSNEEIADKYKLHSRYISLIRHKKRLKYIWDTYFKDIEPVKSDKNRSKIDLTKIETIVKESLTTKESNTSLGRKFNVDASTISRIRHNNKRLGKHYKQFIPKYTNSEDL